MHYFISALTLLFTFKNPYLLGAWCQHSDCGTFTVSLIQFKSHVPICDLVKTSLKFTQLSVFKFSAILEFFLMKLVEFHYCFLLHLSTLCMQDCVNLHHWTCSKFHRVIMQCVLICMPVPIGALTCCSLCWQWHFLVCCGMSVKVQHIFYGIILSSLYSMFSHVTQ